jgi:hypothetical protein
MDVISVIAVVLFCIGAVVLLYGICLLENDSDDFRKKHGVKPKYYRCVTKGDMYCNHAEWCDAEIALYPEEYEAEMKRVDNDENQGDGKK